MSYKTQIIEDFMNLKIPIIYILDIDKYYVPSNVNLFNPSDHHYQNKVKCRDVSELIVNMGTTFQNKEVLFQHIKRLPEINLEFSEGVNFFYFS